MKQYIRLLLCFLAALICLFLAGCPHEIDTEAVKTGDYFKSVIETSLYNRYRINFREYHKIEIEISYVLADGIIQNVIFQLDGYDPQKKIGYKVVTKEDKEIWQKERIKGNLKAPNLEDVQLIQKKAIEHQFPVIFITTYNFLDQLDHDSIVNNQSIVLGELMSILNTPHMKKWSREGLYNGDWIKEGLEETCLVSYGIYFSNNDLPVVEIPYGQDRKAIFELSGFDEKRQIGYKFVTAEDEINWNRMREEGDMDAPNLSDSEAIKEQALFYDFPVLFIYVPKYWETTITDIFNQELSKPLNMNEHIKKWLEDSKS